MRSKSILYKRLLCLLLLPAILCPTAIGKIIYVDDDAPADFNTIQEAIDDANDGDTVLVAPGTYTGDGNRDIEFKGKAITVKSEEGPKSCIIDCQGVENKPHRGFYFHNNEDSNSVVQGFTVTYGYMGPDSGGAFFCIESSPIIRDCIIFGNTARNGGGIYAYQSDVLIENCIIRENTASFGSTNSEGGGIGVYHGNAQLRNCLIMGNTTSGLGGGIYCFKGDHQIINCTITDNRTGNRGGGISIGPGSVYECYLCNSVVWSNSAGMFGDNIELGQAGILPVMRLNVSNSLIGEDPNSVYDPFEHISGQWLMTDPLFAHNGYWDPNGTQENPYDDFWIEGDYHLKSQAGRWDPNSQSWVIDDVTSPCIDAGDPNTPVGDEPIPNGGIINMGAYGGTAEASKSYILAKTIYVNDDAMGANDGSSWENAYIYLQDALADANDSIKPVEIRVAQGTYKPNQGLLPIIPPSENIGRGGPSLGVWPADQGIIASFNLINDVTIKGGYAGLWDSDSNIRDIKLYETILSGDLNGDDIKIAEKINSPYDLIDEPNRSDNNLHVVRSSYNDATAVIDGFTITGGWDMSVASDGRTGGAGMRIYSGNPTIKNCVFTGNAALGVGGGIFNTDSNPMLIDCRFTGNYAGYGGGISNEWGSVFTPSQSSNPTIVDCIFNDNYAFFSGGGIYNSDSNPNLTNCTISKNFADNGAAVFGGSPKLTNCIVWYNVSPQIISDASVSFSNIQGSWDGEGNIDEYPLFADPNNGDYHLKSQAGRWDPASGGWVIDDVTSPCIDAGDPNSSIGDEPSPNGGIINMGAYGGSSQASKSVD